MKNKFLPLLLFITVLGFITFFSFRIALIIFSLFLLLKVLHKVLLSDLTNIYKNSALIINSFLAVVLLLEIAFMYIPQSHGVNYAKAAQIWRKYYWYNPRNTYGCRDTEIDLKDTLNKEKKLIYALGDSFTEGQGIENYKDRYTDKLETLIGKKYKVCNLGISGNDTRDEYRRLISYKRHPDFLILQYYGNDIENIAREKGKIYTLSEPGKKDMNSFSKFFIDNSYFLNYIYWQFPHSELNSYSGFLKEAYSDRKIMSTHLGDIEQFVQYSKKNNIPFVVLVFPYMTDIQGSEFYTKPIESFLNENNVTFIDVGELIKNIPVRDRVAGKFDAHSSELVHELVSVELFKKIKDKL